LLDATSAVGLVGMAVAPLSASPSVSLDAVCAGILGVIAAGLIVWGGRIGGRGLLGLAAVRIAIAAAVVGVAQSAGATFFACAGFLWVALWVAVFFPRRVQALTLGAELLAVVVAVAVNDHHVRTGVDSGAILAVTVIVSMLLSQALAGLGREARHDHLTGVLNRYGLDQALTHSGQRAREVASLVAIDLDGLKLVNDRDGHLAGDRMLVDFATELAAAARRTDLTARVGGDEFIAILPGASAAEATRWARELRARSSVSWSFGVAERTPDEPLEPWLARADQFMYAAKPADRVQLRSVPASA
jgi:diguanylate cyclase (GGDEF)-like protein